jgi:carboxylesterase type B
MSRDKTIVDLSLGKVKGVYHNSLHYYLGVPFAKTHIPHPLDVFLV